MSQKKFKYPLTIKGTPEQLKSIAEKLLTFGYRFGKGNERRWGAHINTLVTNSQSQSNLYKEDPSGRMDYRTHSILDTAFGRTVVSANNRDLVFALAAMVDDEEFYPGEYVIVINDGSTFDTHTRFTYKNSYDQRAPENTLLKVIEPIEYTSQPALHLETPDGYKNFLVGKISPFKGKSIRKATKEEILAHFTDQELTADKLLMKDLTALAEKYLDDKNIREEFGPFQDSQNIISEKPVETHVPARIGFIKELYDGSDDEARAYFEKEFPTLFPRLSFKVGDRIKQFFNNCDVDGSRDLIIIGPANEKTTGHKRIVLADLKNGLIKDETISVEDLNNITERELLEAGKAWGLTRSTYAKYTSTCEE